MRVIIAGLLFWAAGSGLPDFDKYKTAERFAGTPAAPIPRTRLQRNFRTVIREAAKSGPNFAGHYALATWGCGAGCVSIAVVDEKNGTTTDGPFEILGYDLSFSYEGGEEQIEFHPDSRLLIARGCPGEKDCGTYYYEWTGQAFRLIQKTAAKAK